MGTGTVGGGCIDILKSHREEFKRHYGIDVELVRVCSRNPEQAIEHGVEDIFTQDFHDILNDPDIDIVIELIGGTTVARDVVLGALRAGKNVVTANKALMATHGEEVMRTAEEAGKEIAFEASVGGGIPIIDPMKHSLIANRIDSVMGIVNGTTNYMLTRMAEDDMPYADVLAEAGCPEEEAARQAEAIFAMEQRWAPAMLSSEERNDFAVLNTMYRRNEIEAFMPHMDGRRLLSSWKLTKEKKLFLADAAYLQKLDEAYVQDNLPLLKSYAVFRIMDGFAPYADRRLRDLQRSYTQYRFGITKSRSDEETASRMVQGLLPYEFGQIYMKDHCSPDAVRDVKAMIDEIRGVYRERLLKNDWLGEDTKKEAVGKLDALRVFVGGPAADDKPIVEDMPDVIAEADGGDLLRNIMHNAVLVQAQVHRLIGTDFDPDKWYAFQPQDVNAAYIPANNSITIPAGILNPPFYSPDASYGANLGGIGVVIGHEISHAFDPNGSQYDKDGNMKNWWTAGDYARFRQKAAAFAPYYSRYKVGEGLYENGALVANEAIADCGGLSVATEIAGCDEETLRDLYRNFAAIFASKMTPQLLLQSVQTDPHPIMQARVNGALSATDSFYEAYDVENGDGMYVAPEQRVKLW